jgi:hypothetical protein
MRWLLASVVLCSLTTQLAAQEQPTTKKRFITTQECDNVFTMTQLIVEKYKEQPLFTGQGLQISAQTGQPYMSDMMYFVNQDTGTWSLVSLYPDGTSCMVANGNSFDPYTGPKIPTGEPG